MDVKEETPHRCGACREVLGCQWQGYVYCSWLRHDVWAMSLMCPHGKDLLDSF